MSVDCECKKKYIESQREKKVKKRREKLEKLTREEKEEREREKVRRCNVRAGPFHFSLSLSLHCLSFTLQSVLVRIRGRNDSECE